MDLLDKFMVGLLVATGVVMVAVFVMAMIATRKR